MRRIPVMLVVSLLALCLTATAAFAAHPNSHANPNIADPSAIVVPDQPGPSASDADETEVEESEAPDESENEDPSAHPSNHGLIVSEAAQATTPDGCNNHGQWVSQVARGVVDPNEPNATCTTEPVGNDKAATHGKPSQRPKR